MPSMVVLAFGVGRPWWWQRARKRRSRLLRVTVVPASWVSSAASSRVSAVARVGSGEGGEGGIVGELEDLVAVEEVLEVGSLEGRGEVEEGAGAVDADAGSRSPVARGRDVDEARAARPELPERGGAGVAQGAPGPLARTAAIQRPRVVRSVWPRA